MSQPIETKDLPASPPKPRPSMSTRNRLLFFITGWLLVLMPFLFWWNTWFGRHLSDKQVTEYLHDNQHPRHIQHALIQMGERMSHHDTSVTGWYPELVRLSTHSVEEVRNTDAWVLGQDTSGPGFHEALTKMLADSSPVVRGNAALSLVRFGDATGRPQIVALLQSVKITAPSAGRIVDASKPGTAIHQNGLIAKLQPDQPGASPQTIELRSPISGRIRNLFVQTGQAVTTGSEIASVDPATDQVWEALRALYLIGQFDDLSAITPYTRNLPEVPDHIRQQAVLTEKAIRDRANAQGH